MPGHGIIQNKLIVNINTRLQYMQRMRNQSFISLSPGPFIQKLKLLHTIYRKTATRYHFVIVTGVFPPAGAALGTFEM